MGSDNRDRPDFLYGFFDQVEVLVLSECLWDVADKHLVIDALVKKLGDLESHPARDFTRPAPAIIRQSNLQNMQAANSLLKKIMPLVNLDEEKVKTLTALTERIDVVIQEDRKKVAPGKMMSPSPINTNKNKRK
ncbi:MAG: hypothetical protein ACYCX4_00380 [Bacillota bacterium]